MTSALPDFRDDFSYKHHLIYSKPVATSDIASGTSRLNVTPHMRLGVINSIQSSIMVCSTTVNAWLLNITQDLFRGKIASIYFNVSIAQRYSPPFRTSSVAKLSSTNLLFLLWAKITPAISSVFTTNFSLSMASTAFVGNPQRPRRVFHKRLDISWKRLFAAITSSGICSFHRTQ